MKTFIYNSAIIAALSLTFNLAATNAQKMSDKVYPGYAVTNAGDTIKGQISMLTPALNQVKVKMTDEKGAEKNFKADELQAYAFKVKMYNAKEERHFEQWIFYTRKMVEIAPIPFGSKDVLVERPQKGALNLYNYYVERNGDVENPIQHLFYIEKGKSTTLIEINRDNFKETMKDLTKDFPELSNKVGTPDFGFNQIEKIVSTYNQWRLENTEEIASSVQ